MLWIIAVVVTTGRIRGVTMERKLEHVGVCGRQKAKKVRARTPHRRGTTLRVRLAGDGDKNSAAMADGKRAHMEGAYQEHVATLARQAEERHAEGGSTAGRGRRKQVGQRIDKPMASQVVADLPPKPQALEAS